MPTLTMPHSEEFAFRDAKVAPVMAREDVDLTGMSLEYVDAMLAKAGAQEDCTY
jgi:hypothetical protein